MGRWDAVKSATLSRPASRFGSRRGCRLLGLFGLARSGGALRSVGGLEPQGFHDSGRLFGERLLLGAQLVNLCFDAADLVFESCFLFSGFQVGLLALALCQYLQLFEGQGIETLYAALLQAFDDFNFGDVGLCRCGGLIGVVMDGGISEKKTLLVQSSTDARVADADYGPGGLYSRSNSGVLYGSTFGAQFAGTVTTGVCDVSVTSAMATRSCTTVRAYFESKSASSIQNWFDR